MNIKYLAKYFLDRCKVLRTFEIDSWIDENGYPKDYHGGYIHSTVEVPEGTIQQSLYMAAGKTIYMGLLDCVPGIGNDEVDLDIEYHFDSMELTLNYNNITLQEAYEVLDCEEESIQLHIALAPTEELHFQDSLVEVKYFTYEEEQMMLSFFNEIRARFFENKVPIK